MKWFTRVVIAGALVLEVFFLLAPSFWFFELFIHYLIPYTAISLVCAAFFLSMQKWRAAMTLVILAFLNMPAFFPYLQIPDESTEAAELKILASNVFLYNKEIDDFFEELEVEDPDIVVIHEAAPQWMDASDRFQESYPYLGMTTEEGSSTAILMASRIPGSFEVIDFGPQSFVEFTPESGEYKILAVHPLPAIVPPDIENYKILFEAMSDYAQDTELPLMLIGDFNATPWSPSFKTLLRDAQLHDARLGFGIWNTWHSKIPILRIPIDHALVTEEWQIQNFKALTIQGSDHKAIVVEGSVD